MRENQKGETERFKEPIGRIDDNAAQFWAIWCQECGGFIGSIWLRRREAAQEAADHNRDHDYLHHAHEYEVHHPSYPMASNGHQESAPVQAYVLVPIVAPRV
ncbi:hypothetical protein ACGF0J_25550 [Nonomuraea sp. NPDC047897]|uniref:hypothetical protein n=1 Tax=Nonomuraea sp. NPDC047897 TaxID=3364346 RepID=UPI00371FB945